MLHEAAKMVHMKTRIPSGLRFCRNSTHLDVALVVRVYL